MRVLMLVNWDVYRTHADDVTRLGPNSLVEGERYWFFKHWPDADVQVDVIDYSRLPIIHIFEKRLFKLYITQALRALPSVARYDLVLSHGAQSALPLALVRAVLGKSVPPHVVIDVGSFNGGRVSPIELAPIRLASTSLAGVIYHARRQREYYEDCLPGILARSAYVPFGMDIDFFRPDDGGLSAQDSGIRHEERTNPDEGAYAISIGYSKRDWRTLIKALELLRSKMKLIVVGSTDLGMKLPPNVECRPYIPIQELIALTRKARFAVLPLPYYRYSYGQMTLLQSMSLGKAVIATSVPGVEDYVTDGATGLLVEPYDPVDLAQKLDYLASNPAVAERIGVAARASCETTFNEKTMALGIRREVAKLCDI